MNRIVSREEWTQARREFLAKEKAFTRERDAISEARRQLPWVKVDKRYELEGSRGKQTLGDLFGGKSQLIVYHFMFGPDWEAGCSSCSFWADNFDGIITHLEQRDVAMVAISRAPYDKIAAFRARMGWSFHWLSSAGTDFNQDFHVSFAPEERETGYYNYANKGFPSTEGPGISVFCRRDGEVFHTYSCYARGLDMLNGAYHYLDLVPKGRDEKDLKHPQEWIKLRDRY
jgi:predicted dithiol-disulfide oxidoreductase (DUF899 family)